MPNGIKVYSNGATGAFAVALGPVVVSRLVRAHRPRRGIMEPKMSGLNFQFSSPVRSK